MSLPLSFLSFDEMLILAVWAFLGLLIGPALHAWIKVAEFFKGRSFDSSKYLTVADFQTQKEERDRQMEEFKETMAGNFKRLESTLKTLADDMPAIHRALGRLEGHDEAAPKRRR